MLATLLSRTALAAVPGVGAVASLLVPVLSYVITTREVDIHISIR